MSNYLCDRFEWTHRQIRDINWRAVEMAKKRLDKTRSIRTSKMMHHWLPIGHQTERVTGIHSDGTCPCCGKAHEDQDHLFTCQHHAVKEARSEAADSAETHLLGQNLPPAVVIAFMNVVQKATGLTKTDKSFECPHARKAAEAQSSLGSKAILRGHIHTELFMPLKTRTENKHTPQLPGRGTKRTKPLLSFAQY